MQFGIDDPWLYCLLYEEVMSLSNGRSHVWID